MHPKRLKALQELVLRGVSRLTIYSKGFTEEEITTYTDLQPLPKYGEVAKVLATLAGDVQSARKRVEHHKKAVRRAQKKHDHLREQLFHTINVAVEAEEITQTEAAKATGLTKYKVNYELRKWRDERA